MTVSMNDSFQQKVRVINPFSAAPPGSGTVREDFDAPVTVAGRFRRRR
jgi:hypothetical protein